LIFSKNDQGDERCFIVMEKITGTDLRKTDSFSESQLSEFAAFINSALDFYLGIKRDLSKSEGESNDECYFPDFLNVYYTGEASFRNIMLGKKKGDTENHIYFVDNYPMIRINNQTSNPEIFMLYSLKSALREFDTYRVFEPWWKEHAATIIPKISEEDVWKWHKRVFRFGKEKYLKKTDENGIGQLLMKLKRDYYYEKLWSENYDLKWTEQKKQLFSRIKKLKSSASDNGRSAVFNPF
jgi:hypothetical protein